MKSGARVLFVWESETRVTEGFREQSDCEGMEWETRQRCDPVSSWKSWMVMTWPIVGRIFYDYLLVATSSYAEGDPPSGFGKFLYRLQETSKECDGNPTDPSCNNQKRKRHNIWFAMDPGCYSHLLRFWRSKTIDRQRWCAQCRSLLLKEWELFQNLHGAYICFCSRPQILLFKMYVFLTRTPESLAWDTVRCRVYSAVLRLTPEKG